MEDITEGKWGDCHRILHGSEGKELIVRKEQIALLEICRKAKEKAKRTKKYKKRNK